MRRLTVIALPGEGDAYTDLLYPALRAAGVRVISGIYSGRWLLAHLGDADFVHLHWPSFFYSAPGGARTALKLAKFLVFLVAIRAMGVRIAWTAHNLYPHERSSPPSLDRMARWGVLRLASLVFVHGATPERLLRAEFPWLRLPIVAVPHGHMIDLYPRGIGRAEARARLRIPDESHVFAFVGGCRPYKNLESLVSTFQRGFGDAVLLIAGRFQDQDYRRAIDELIAREPHRIVLRDAYIEPGEMQVYFAAADTVVLPFREIMTSGSAILSLGFGKPVVAPSMGHLVDLVDPSVGVLYDPTDPDGLFSAMNTAMQATFETREIVRRAEALTWDEAAAITADAMCGALGRARELAG